MLASVACHAPVGIDGQVVRVEVDLRRGIPGIDIVGLPDCAVRESRERVRVAIRNSGFQFPRERVLVNLAPAGIRKEGASFDLAIAFAVLAASEQVPPGGLDRVMVLGELNLSGDVLPVTGVLAAVATGIKAGLARFLVPTANLREALCLGLGRVCGIASLAEGARGLRGGSLSAAAPPQTDPEPPLEDLYGDLSDIRGCERLKRALEVAAAGGHNLFLCGPPGSGKTMAARRLATLLPPLDRDESLEVTRVHSLAGALPAGGGLITRRPFRMPHHTASAEGIIGGGRLVRPGEVSLAHRGVLFLDEVLEFRQALLQSLREPVEDRWVTVVRAGSSIRYPAAFQLVLAANGCPCGKLGPARRALPVLERGDPLLLETAGRSAAGPHRHPGACGARVSAHDGRAGRREQRCGARAGGRRCCGSAPALRRPGVPLERRDPAGPHRALLQPRRRDSREVRGRGAQDAPLVAGLPLGAQGGPHDRGSGAAAGSCARTMSWRRFSTGGTGRRTRSGRDESPGLGAPGGASGPAGRRSQRLQDAVRRDPVDPPRPVFELPDVFGWYRAEVPYHDGRLRAAETGVVIMAQLAIAELPVLVPGNHLFFRPDYLKPDDPLRAPSAPVPDKEGDRLVGEELAAGSPCSRRRPFSNRRSMAIDPRGPRGDGCLVGPGLRALYLPAQSSTRFSTTCVARTMAGRAAHSSCEW